MEVGTAFGLGNFQTETWYGLYAPKATAPEVIGFLNAEVNKLLMSTRMKERLNFYGAESVGGSAQQFANDVKKDRARWSQIIQKNHIVSD